MLGGAGNQEIGENKGLESEGKEDKGTTSRKVTTWHSLFSASFNQSLNYFPPQDVNGEIVVTPPNDFLKKVSRYGSIQLLLNSLVESQILVCFKS